MRYFDTIMESEIWPEDAGRTTLDEFAVARSITQRALQTGLEEFCNKYFTRNEQVLEIGSGLGYLHQQWPDQFHGKWTQVDGQHAFLQQTRKTSLEDYFVNASVYDLPFVENSFDAVCGLCSFDVFQNLDKAMSEVYRVLKPGGMFFHLQDLGPDLSVLQQDLIQQKIPCMIFGETSTPSFFSGAHSHIELYSIPGRNVDNFLDEIGMSTEEFASISLDGNGMLFGLDRFRHQQFPNFDSMDETEKWQAMDSTVHAYRKIFHRYARIVDGREYFHSKLKGTVASVFGTSEDERLDSRFTGPRSFFQRDKFPDMFYFERDRGHPRGGCTYGQFLSRPLLRLFSQEPKVIEVSKVDCVRAYKKMV